MVADLNLMLAGAIAIAYFIVSMFFLKFWSKTKDRFFLLFAASFFIEGINRLLLGSMAGSNEYEAYIYLSRLCAFLIIIYAVLDKNRVRKI